MRPAAAAPVLRNPFPGLRPFREDEEYLFFGRENQVDAMVDKLAATRFLAVVGTSGSGKSSLVNCGLRPALHGGLMAPAGTAWRMAQFRPGSDPLGAMARALAEDGVLFRGYDPEGLALEEIVDTTLRMSKLGLIDICEQAQLGADANLLVVVDQFEELFRYRQLAGGRQEDAFGVSEEATAFVNLLLEASEQKALPIYIVLTMRSDFLGDCTQFTGLAEAINAGQYLVPRMTRDERRAAIRGPVGVAGAGISPVLLTRLVNDVGDNPDQLSILQHALNRTWASWEAGGGGGQLDLQHYEAIGTMDHALDQHAETAYAEVSGARRQLVCERLFKALTDKATDPRGVRRPTKLATLCALAEAPETEITEVIELFRDPSRSFLMPPAGEALGPETVVDISHESLMRVWGRLRGWADEEAAAAAEYLRLADSAARWRAGDADLLAGRELDRAEQWKLRQNPNRAWAERYDRSFVEAMDYLAASQAAERKRLELARRRRLGLRAAIAFVLVVFATLALVAYRQKLNAQYREGLAWMLRAEVAEERGKRYPDTLLYAARAIGFDGLGRPGGTVSGLPRLIRKGRDPAAYEQARAWIRERPDYLPVWSTAIRESPVTAMATSPDGRYLAVAAEDGKASLWDLATGEETEVSPPTGSAARALAFHPDGQLLAVAGPEEVRLWNLPSGSFSGAHPGTVSALAYNPGGEILAGAAADGSILMWRDGARIPIATVQTGPASALSFSSDDSALAAVYPGAALNLFFHQVEERHRSWEQDIGEVTAAAFSPDGFRLAIGFSNGAVSLWDAASARPLGEVVPQQRHQKAVLALAFRNDGTQLASASADKTIRLWNAESDVPDLLATLSGHLAAVAQLAFLPGDTLLVSASADGSAKLWDLSGRTGHEPALHPYLAQSWYDFDPQTQEAGWRAGTGFLNLPPDSLVGTWQRTEGEGTGLFARFLGTGEWAAALVLAGQGAEADRERLAAALLTDAGKAAREYRWNRVRLRLRQLDKLGAAGGAEVADILNKMAEITAEGKDFVNGDGVELLWAPAGSFAMGSLPTEAGRDSIETRHRVTLTHGFWIGKYEVTQSQYLAVMGVNPSAHQSVPETLAKEFQGNWAEVAPVENISWFQAMEFCRKLTDRERARGALPRGWEYNLPSEAQWEYAGRAGTETAYSYGDDVSRLHEYANWGPETKNTGTVPQNRYSVPVGSYRPNPWGLFDVHGNVWEWVRDAHDPLDTDYPPGPATDPLVTQGSTRRLRGGSFISTAGSCRSAKRDAFPPEYQFGILGLRVALVSAASSQSAASASQAP